MCKLARAPGTTGGCLEPLNWSAAFFPQRSNAETAASTTCTPGFSSIFYTSYWAHPLSEWRNTMEYHDIEPWESDCHLEQPPVGQTWQAWNPRTLKIIGLNDWFSMVFHV